MHCRRLLGDASLSELDQCLLTARSLRSIFVGEGADGLKIEGLTVFFNSTRPVSVFLKSSSLKCPLHIELWRDILNSLSARRQNIFQTLLLLASFGNIWNDRSGLFFELFVHRATAQ